MAKDSDLLSDALEQFRLAEEAESENREAALADIKFARLGEQWDDTVRRQREQEGRPCLTINRLPAFARQVVNDCRQNKPSVVIKPASDQSDIETAEILTGLVRNIEATSDADVAYDTAVENAVYGGFGYIRVDMDYATDDAFDLDLKVARIANPFTVYGDPRSEAADSSDWNVAFVVETLKIADFKRKYKGAAVSNFDAGQEGHSEGWFTDDSVRVAEWWLREQVDREIVKLSDGSIVPLEDLNDPEKLAFLESAGITIVGNRKTKAHQIAQRVITGAEVINTTEWHGRYIPLIPVYGDEVNVEGKRHFRSLLRDAKDPQRMFNAWRTASTELVAMAPRVPWVGPRGAFMSDAEKWNTANRKSHAYIEYDGPIAPTRLPLDGGIAAGALQEALNAADDMKAIMGVFDASLGARSNETSGLAIRARQREGDVSTFHFIDNLNRAIRHTGRVLLDLIPKVYTRERIIRVLGEDGTPSAIPLGQPVQWKNAHKVFDLTVGKYDVVVKAGPSFGTRREEAAEQMIATMQAFPPIAPQMVDLLAANLDWPGAEKLKERIEQQQANPPPNPEVVKAQAQGQLEQMKAQAQAQLEQMKAQTTAQLEQMKAQAEAEKARLLAEVDLEKSRQEALIDAQRSAADAEAKAQIEREKIASQERMKAAELAAQREKTMLELASGILSAREGVKGQNISNGSTLDQTGGAVPPPGKSLHEQMGDIKSAAETVSDILMGGAPKKKQKKARISKQPDGGWLAEELDDEPGTAEVRNPLV